ncbi:hypothetical protein MTR_1g095420 [Medicago truncatula]|uniref:Uncharacterized protein n=1 Tax=Medicago truncatula TaxID=3880 RepID=G7I3C2_MEDTR|nr:hypothetical protein MTR_1g095420 [Medicago truncatula]
MGVAYLCKHVCLIGRLEMSRVESNLFKMVATIIGINERDIEPLVNPMPNTAKDVAIERKKN